MQLILHAMYDVYRFFFIYRGTILSLVRKTLRNEDRYIFFFENSQLAMFRKVNGEGWDHCNYLYCCFFTLRWRDNVFSLKAAMKDSHVK